MRKFVKAAPGIDLKEIAAYPAREAPVDEETMEELRLAPMCCAETRLERTILRFLRVEDGIDQARIVVDVPMDECPKDADVCPVVAYALTADGDVVEVQGRVARRLLEEEYYVP